MDEAPSHAGSQPRLPLATVFLVLKRDRERDVLLPVHFVSVAGVVVDDGRRVLLTRRRDNGRWEAPGGVLEPGEAFHDGVRREVHEETGLTVDVEALTGVHKNVVRDVVAVVFRCRAVGGSMRLSDETVDIEWLDLAEAVSRMDEAYAVRVSDAFHETPAARAHDGFRVTSSA